MSRPAAQRHVYAGAFVEFAGALFDAVDAQQVGAQIRADQEAACRVEEDFVWVRCVLLRDGAFVV